MTKWLWQLKWALVLAIFAGPAFAYWSYNDGKRIERVLANGAEIVASVDGGVVNRGRRGSTSYSLDLSWSDAEGVPHHENIDISGALADQIIVADTVMIDQIQVRNLPSETGGPTVIVVDAPQQLETAQFGFYLGIAAGIAGLIFAPLWFWLERRFAKKQEDDIDATLAQMRAGQAPQP